MGIIKKFSIFNFQFSKFKINNLRSNLSFTLIEAVVVIGVIGITLPALFAIIFVILQQQIKINRLQQIKKEGDFILAAMTTTIKNSATFIYKEEAFTNEECGKSESLYPASYSDADGKKFYFKDKNGRSFNYYLDNGKISSDSSSFASPIDLTTGKVIVNSFQISCQRTAAFSTPTVSITLTVKYNTASTRPEETASLTYNTRIKLKNY